MRTSSGRFLEQHGIPDEDTPAKHVWIQTRRLRATDPNVYSYSYSQAQDEPGWGDALSVTESNIEKLNPVAPIPQISLYDTLLQEARQKLQQLADERTSQVQTVSKAPARLLPHSDISEEDLMLMRQAAENDDRQLFVTVCADAWAKGTTTYSNIILHFKRHHPDVKPPAAEATRMSNGEAAKILHYARQHIQDLRTPAEFRAEVAKLCRETGRTVDGILNRLEKEGIVEPGSKMTKTAVSSNTNSSEQKKSRRVKKVEPTTVYVVKDSNLCFTSEQLAEQCEFTKQDLKSVLLFSSVEVYQEHAESLSKMSKTTSFIKSLSPESIQQAIDCGVLTKELVNQVLSGK